MRDDEREVQLFFVGSGHIFFAGSSHIFLPPPQATDYAEYIRAAPW